MSSVRPFIGSSAVIIRCRADGGWRSCVFVLCGHICTCKIRRVSKERRCSVRSYAQQKPHFFNVCCFVAVRALRPDTSNFAPPYFLDQVRLPIAIPVYVADYCLFPGALQGFWLGFAGLRFASPNAVFLIQL